MELKIKPFPKNNYPKRGVLINSASPLVWLREIESLGIDLNMVQSFAIPSLKPNILYGCFIVFGGHAPNEIGKNSYFQCFDNKLFIPENTDFYPKINSEDWKHIDAKYIIMHPDFGLVKLNETIDWVSILEESLESESQLKKPSNGVFIPQKIRSFKVDMDDDELLEQLLKPITDEEWMKNLPFDLEKVRAGNHDEILKYIEYITKYPERAVYLGIPLDIHDALRGGFGDFDFGMFGNFFGNNENNSKENQSAGKISGLQKIFVALFALVVIILFAINFDKKKEEQKEVLNDDIFTESHFNNKPYPEIDEGLVFESGLTEIDRKIDSMFGNERRWLINDYRQSMNTKEGRSTMLWKIEEYRAKERQAREIFKQEYLKKIESVVNLKTKTFYRKILDSIQKDPLNKMSVKSKVLLADDILEMRKIVITDSLARIYGTSHEIDPKIVFNNNGGKEAFNINKEGDGKKEITLSEIVWLFLALVALIGVYFYFIRKKPLYMGGNHVSDGIKIFLIALLGVALLYIFYPLINTFGYNWLVCLLIVGVVVLLYRLFDEEVDILKPRKK
ncbi:APC family permease [Chryseobacterium sp. GP-SGM7]|uniref:APC family permease n=1 Tax=Chryseobacterium sp. GP-SGM7 TaxID=3411323 RepID=UPI003B92D1E2